MLLFCIFSFSWDFQLIFHLPSGHVFYIFISVSFRGLLLSSMSDMPVNFILNWINFSCSVSIFISCQGFRLCPFLFVSYYSVETLANILWVVSSTFPLEITDLCSGVVGTDIRTTWTGPSSCYSLPSCSWNVRGSWSVSSPGGWGGTGRHAKQTAGFAQLAHNVVGLGKVLWVWVLQWETRFVAESTRPCFVWWQSWTKYSQDLFIF
jgi:hypothetical protein